MSIHDKHIELIVRQMLRRVLVAEPGDAPFLPGERVDNQVYAEVNRQLVEEGKRPAEGRPELMGITKASLATDSWLSAASFQETTRVLTEAAIEGRSDQLFGLKENIIIGKLIPAGIGHGALPEHRASTCPTPRPCPSGRPEPARRRHRGPGGVAARRGRRRRSATSPFDSVDRRQLARGGARRRGRRGGDRGPGAPRPRADAGEAGASRPAPGRPARTDGPASRLAPPLPPGPSPGCRCRGVLARPRSARSRTTVQSRLRSQR